MVKQATVLMLLSVCAAVAAHWFHPEAPAWYVVEVPLAEGEVDLAEVERRWKGDVLWLDARPRDQFEKGHIPGAHLLNEQEFDELVLANIDLLQSPAKPVVIYCSGQACKASHAVRDRLITTGIIHENAFVLRGGFPAWEAAGRLVEKP